jgi:hypothetical protein
MGGILVAVAVAAWLFFSKDEELAARSTDYYERQQETLWEEALQLPFGTLRGQLGDQEERALMNGAPEDWADRGWPTPFGPWSQPRRFWGV